jgi:hypothetical protein
MRSVPLCSCGVFGARRRCRLGYAGGGGGGAGVCQRAIVTPAATPRSVCADAGPSRVVVLGFTAASPAPPRPTISDVSRGHPAPKATIGPMDIGPMAIGHHHGHGSEDGEWNMRNHTGGSDALAGAAARGSVCARGRGRCARPGMVRAHCIHAPHEASPELRGPSRLGFAAWSLVTSPESAQSRVRLLCSCPGPCTRSFRGVAVVRRKGSGLQETICAPCRRITFLRHPVARRAVITLCFAAGGMAFLPGGGHLLGSQHFSSRCGFVPLISAGTPVRASICATFPLPEWATLQLALTSNCRTSARETGG